MPPITEQTGSSAEVRLWLEAEGATYPLAQVGPDLIVFRDPTALPPCDAAVVMEVDGEPQRWPVRLRLGVSKESRLVSLK